MIRFTANVLAAAFTVGPDSSQAVKMTSQSTADSTSILPAILLLVLVGLVCIYLVSTRQSKSSLDEEWRTKSVASKEEVEIEGETFYQNLTTRKWALIGILVVLATYSIFRIACDAVVGNRSKAMEDLLMTLFWIINIVLATLSLSLPTNRRYSDRNWDYTVCLTSSTLAALASTLFRLAVPSSLAITPTQSTGQLLSTVFLITFESLAFYIVGTSDRAPQMGLVITSTELEAMKSTPAPPTESSPLLSTFVSSHREISSRAEMMPSEHRLSPVSPIVSCSPISYILFSWISPVLATGNRVISLSASDLPLLAANDRASTLWNRINGSKGEGGPKWANALLWRLLVVNSRLFWWQSGLAFTNAFLYYLPAFFLQRLVMFLENSSTRESSAWGYCYSLGLLFSCVLDALVSGQLWFVSNSMLSTRIRVELNSLVFDKTLKRKDVSGGSNQTTVETKTKGKGKQSDESEEKKADADEGESFSSRSGVLNLFTIDVDRVSDFSIWCFSILDAPTEIIIGTFFLYQLLGYAAFVGISVAVLFLPINHYASKQFAQVQNKLMVARDKRVSLMNEVLQSIRMIKFFAFEHPFEARILVARDEELRFLKRNFYLEVAFQFIWTASPILCVLVSFYVYTVVMGERLTPSTAFAALAVWNELRFALNIIPDLIVNAIQCLVSLRRIEAYLALPEVDPLEDEHSTSSLAFNDAIGLNCATITWPTIDTKEEKVKKGTATPGGQRFELQDLTIDFKPQQLNVITGPIGSGKTLLLLSLLGEAELLAGQIICPTKSTPSASALPSLDWEHLNENNWIEQGRSAFCSQSAWLQSESIRNNILFGLPYRPGRYQRTLDACSLVSDLDNFEDGDSTEIGEKGVSLSGGMKARVSLARAVYSRAAILLLDDVLSAVDAHTALKIYTDCLKGPLLAGRTVILVSHHVQLVVPGADFVVSLENGRVSYQGEAMTYLASLNTELVEEEDAIEAIKSVVVVSPKARNKVLDTVVADSAPNSTDVSSASENGDSDTESVKIVKVVNKPAKKMIEDERREVGRVSRAVWSLYLGFAGGSMYFALFAFAFLGSKFAAVAESLWLAVWSSSYDTSSGLEDVVPRSVSYYLGVYAFLSFAAAIIYTLQWLVLYAGSLRASENLHKLLLRSVLRAPLRFFETTSIGRTLNRFGKDMESIDSTLPDHYGRSVEYSLGVITTLAVITSIRPVFLVGFGLLSIVYYKNALVYSKSARELRRLDSVSKSPLYSIYEEAITGIAVIRAFGASSRFMRLFRSRCENNITFYWYLWSVNRWLSIRFALLSSLVVGLTGLTLVSAQTDAALAGFALSFSLNITTELLFLVRRYTALELAMVAVERLKEYTEIKQEAAEIVYPRPAPAWPHAGKVEIKDLSIRYDPSLPNVLHNITFSVAAGEKVGIVGATGSGKSTIALSFFRFVEAFEGSITIDDLNIADIGLTDLRRRLTIIPQDPTILSGTLRSTLDIFGEYKDPEIYDALRRVHLIKPEDEDPLIVVEEGANRSPFLDLDGEVSEGGLNFSQGQRQLLCMARALLRKNRIILMDEATASVDAKTDEAISETIRELTDSTLLVIAHRLRTIAWFDKVLLLDQGRLIEFDSPANLIKDPTSRFHSLCRATGKGEFKVLKRMAEKKRMKVKTATSSSGDKAATKKGQEGSRKGNDPA